MKITRSFFPALTLATVSGFALTCAAHAASTVQLTYSIDGVSQTKMFSDDDGDGFISGSFMFMSEGNMLSGQFSTIDDPLITLAVSSIDEGIASDFSVSAMLMTDLAPASYSYDLTGSGGYTGGFPANGVGLSPSGDNPGVFLGFKDDTLVASAGGAQFTPNGGNVPISDVYGPVTDSGSTLVCAAGCTSETLTIAWTGTGQGDSYGLTAQFLNKPAVVPVPAALPLMISAVAAIGVVGLRRKA